jgi:hypothetical protein
MWSRNGTKIHRKKWILSSGVSLQTIRTAAVKTICYFNMFRRSIINIVMPAADLVDCLYLFVEITLPS